MREQLWQYYRPSDDEFKALWANATFVFDANMLLNLYRYPREARASLLDVLAKIGDRLWLPHQAALEYQENRLSVIAGQLTRFAEVRKVVEDSTGNLRSGLLNLQLPRRHSSIDPTNLLEQVENAAAQFERDLQDLEEHQPKVYEDDKVRDAIDELFRERVGPAPTAALIQDAVTKGKQRFEHQTPPGYGDAGKGKPEKAPPAYVVNGVPIKREFGDLVLWFELLEEAKNKGWKNVILVTDDRKEDWWWIIESGGKKTIGPRPELREEIHRDSGVSCFYMYNSEQFLKYATEYLGAEVKPESIAQVREVREAQEVQGPLPVSRADEGLVAAEAVRRWYQTMKPGANIIEARMGPFSHAIDFVVFDPEGVREGLDVTVFRSPNLPVQLERRLLRAQRVLNDSDLGRMILVFASPGVVHPPALSRWLESVGQVVPIGVTIIVGELSLGPSGMDPTPTFVPLVAMRGGEPPALMPEARQR